MMKQNMMFTDYPELSEKSAKSAASLQKWQQLLLVGLGAVVTYATLGSSSLDSLFDSFTSVFLWIMLLLVPAAGGVVILKFPSWQQIPLFQRKEVILYSFGLSLLTWSTIILFGIQLRPYDIAYWLTSTLVTLCYGFFILWLYFRLNRQAMAEEGDLFP